MSVQMPVEEKSKHNVHKDYLTEICTSSWPIRFYTVSDHRKTSSPEHREKKDYE
jgi:hypothetical protein